MRYFPLQSYHALNQRLPIIEGYTARRSDGDEDPVIGCIERTFGAVDFEIIVVANREGKSYGSTALMALQLGSTLYVAHAGG